MWEMYEDHIECDECGGPGPPPKFMIPPPPRPPSLDYGIINTNCNEEEMALKAAASAQSWDSDMCEAIPILDASLYSSQSLQTSAIIAVFSLLLVLVVLISSLFVWKNKRKVQNFLPCKTPTRGPHMNGGLPGGHSVTYEDPDAHLGHRPLVMRHHHNVEMLHHSKGIHYPSGYPMTRSPPFLVSSSPGPDPYRSNDNVYEELGPGRDSDAESEPPLHSDDDFAEDELSLPGERSFNKSISDTASTIPVSTIYHERISGSQPNNNNNGNGQERNSLLSSSSSSNTHNDTTTVTSAATSTSASSSLTTNNNAPSRTAGILSGVLRHTTGRQNNNRKNNRHKQPTAVAVSSSMDEFNTSAGSEQLVGDMMAVPMAQNHLYDNRNHNLMSLAYNNNTFHHHSLNNNLNNNNNTNNINNNRAQYYNTLENEVERRNRINNQLHHPASAVATIFRERNIVNHPNRYPQPYYAASNLLSSMRSRTNPRSIDRRRIVPPMDPIEPTYGYAEPIFHEGYLYDSCARQQQHQLLPNTVGRNATALVGGGGPLSYPEYIAPDYTSSAGIMGSYRPNTHQHHHHHAAAATGHHHHQQHSHQLYSRGGSSVGGGGDSSFGSDSGYSHHHSSTPASSIGRGVGGGIRGSGSSGNGSGQNKLTAALNFGWNRRQSKQQSQQQQQQPSSNQQLPAPQTSTTSTSSSSSTSTSSSACPKDMNVDRSPNNNSDSIQQPTTVLATTTTPTTTSTDVVNCNTTTAKA
ncbi:probable serine/threonine-protein kinase DDB_G0282963 [Episyrphus balteatus]|uniref:probable serine/threonine-protein kinase DDB_G0282963 n=1 Tax=Episyrphus balteatus TaxID=286459 RepID=UPI002485EC06|nr:probable serine/threonine-protein kinase DDB_G0282963 [Episyrphus balteatus]